MNKYVVTYQKMPTNYNDPVSMVVEAETEDNARLIVKDSLRDLSSYPLYIYKVKNYTPPPSGKIIGYAY